MADNAGTPPASRLWTDWMGVCNTGWLHSTVPVRAQRTSCTTALSFILTSCWVISFHLFCFLFLGLTVTKLQLACCGFFLTDAERQQSCWRCSLLRPLSHLDWARQTKHGSLFDSASIYHFIFPISHSMLPCPHPRSPMDVASTPSTLNQHVRASPKRGACPAITQLTRQKAFW
jgi:hypothetical protein